MKVKFRFDWKKALIFLFVSAGLLYLTKSFLMSLGIILLLFVIDSLLASWEYKRQTKKIFDELRKKNEDEKQDHVHD